MVVLLLLLANFKSSGFYDLNKRAGKKRCGKADNDKLLWIMRCWWSESESSAESGPLNILMDLLGIDRFLDDLPDAEGSISGGIEILGGDVKSTLFRSPGLNFLELYLEIHTCLCLSTSLMLTICPKEGMTLMLMLLSRTIFTRPRQWCSGKT